MAARPDWRADLGVFQTLYAAAFGVFALAVAGLARWERLPYVHVVVFAVAVAARIALLPVDPTLSDDVHRYLWEGRVLLAGANPWASSPGDPALAALRDAAIHPRVNHPELAAIYPPLGALGYALVAAVAPTVLAAKTWVVLHELALIALLMAWLRARGAPPARALVYAWCPLALVEFAGSGHNDATAMPWLVAALMLAERRPVVSALALAAGAMIKLVPLLALPALWRAWPWRARLVAAAALGGGLAAYLALTRGPDSGLAAFAARWRHNELGFLALERLAGGERWGRMLALALLAGLVVVAAWRHAPARATQIGARAAILLAPVVHPWYLAWNLVLEPWSRSPSWLLLSGTVVLSYGVLRAPEPPAFHHPSLALRAFEYGAPLALAAALAWRRRSRG